MHFWKGKSTPGSRSGKICRKLWHPHSEGQHGGEGGFLGPCLACKTFPFTVLESCQNPRTLPAGLYFALSHLCSCNHREVNRRQSSVTFRIRKKSQSPERCGEKSLIPLGFRREGGRWGGCSLVNNAQLCFLIGGLFLLLGSPCEVRRLG